MSKEKATPVAIGLDVGTANILVARPDGDGTKVQRQRNVFLEIDQASLAQSRKMLTSMNVALIEFEQRAFVVGEDAFKLANLFRREVRRPMASGTLNPQEKDAFVIMKAVVEKLVGKTKGTKCCFSVPAPPVDSQDRTIYHQGMVSNIIANCGYDAEAVNEGHAVVLSSMEQEQFTGVGISMGGGMVNVCIAYRALPVISFSVARGGDWIDYQAALAMGSEANAFTAHKETHLKLPPEVCNECMALQLYLDAAIRYILKTIAERFAQAKDVPRFEGPVPVVLAGGTVLIPGFRDYFVDLFNTHARLPFEVGEIRLADDPLTAVARGCLVAASA